MKQKPLLDEQAAEHSLAIERANTLAAELASTIAARDSLDSQVKSLNATSSHDTDELSSLRSTVDDLSQQVQSLLRQLAIRDDPALASQSLDGAAVVPETGDIVSDHLVEFRSIRSLQEQNAKLLRLTRGLMAKLDAREISRATAENDEDSADAHAALDEASRTINTLHEQLLDAHKKINEATRERDLFSKLLARGEGLRWSAAQGGSTGTNGSAGEGSGAGEERVQSLQAELEVIKRRAEGEVRDAKAKAGQAEEAKGKEEVERAKAEAKIGLLEGESGTTCWSSLAWQGLIRAQVSSRCSARSTGCRRPRRKVWRGSWGRCRTECNPLWRKRERCVLLANRGDIVADGNKAAEQAASKQAEADRLRGEAATLRAEKEQWQVSFACLHHTWFVG